MNKLKKTALLALILSIGLSGGVASAKEIKYTVTEIDALRSALKLRYLFGTTCYVAGFSRSYNKAERVNIVESRLRTYMLNGTKANEIIKADKCK